MCNVYEYIMGMYQILYKLEKVGIDTHENINLYRTAFKSRLRAHGTEFSLRRPFKCSAHM